MTMSVPGRRRAPLKPSSIYSMGRRATSLMRTPGRIGAAIFFVAWRATAAPPTEDDAPRVELLESRAVVGAGASTSDRQWETVTLSLHLRNRLPVEVSHLELDIELVGASRPGAAEAPIPGWRFQHAFEDTRLAPLEESFLILEHELASQRRSRSAGEIGYRATIRSYRLRPPSLDLALLLLESSALADQVAAFRSYTFAADVSLPEAALDELKAVLLDDAAKPSATRALRLLFAIRAAGSLADARFVEPLLGLVPRLSSEAWHPALSTLTSGLLEASESDEPRLRLLPVGTGLAPDGSAQPPGEIFKEAIRDALSRLGDVAVPGLVKVAGGDLDPSRRIFARSLLHALGRPTPRAQLSVSDRATRLRVIEALGELGSAEPVSALAELTQSRDHLIQKAALAALRQIGPGAVEPLVDALGTPSREGQSAIISVIREIGPKAAAHLASAAARYGVELEPGASFEERVGQLAEHLSRAAEQRWSAELERGLRLGADSRYDEAFRILDAVYAASPELYMRSSKPIAALYLDRARSLFLRGNFDAAVNSLRVGQSIAPSQAAAELLVRSRLELARGFLELDATDRAEEMLSSPDLTQENEEVRVMRQWLLARQAELAIARGEHSKARSFVDSARRLGPEDARIRTLDRRLLITENLPVVIVLGFLLPAAILASILVLRHRLHVARIRRLETTIDHQE